MHVSVFIPSVYTSILLLSNVNAAPRILSTDYDSNASNKPIIGRLNYKITGVDQAPPIVPQTVDSQTTGNGILQLFGKFFEKNEIITSLMKLFSKMGERAVDEDRANLDDQSLNAKQKYPANQQIPNAVPGIAAQSAKEVQLDEPIPISGDNFNIDAKPQIAGTSDLKFPPIDDEWKSTLFGPKGLLTEVFHFVNDKRKQEAQKTVPQSDSPGPTAASDFNFGKVFEAFLKSGDENFDDPKIPELPFIGICNRLSCGDIFKALDKFKKSEMFSNFQTAMSLINDPKGLDIIGEVLENPELIEQFAGNPENIAEIFGKVEGAAKKKGNSHSMSILPSDGDLGIDFSNEVDPRGNEIKPEIAASTDGGDYYSSVDKVDTKSPDYDYEEAVESVDVEEKVETAAVTTTQASILKKPEPPLPELSFSVDEAVETAGSIDSLPEYGGSVVEIEETVPVLLTKTGIGDSKHKLSALERRFVIERNVTTTTVPTTTITRPSTAVRIFKTTPRAVVTTTRNFRKNNDYYSMYYDN